MTGATFTVADLTKPLADPTPRYHRILLDAPCSGLGVLRRHPEALARRAPGDLETLAAQQLRMLSVVAPVLLPGGLLVYAVCTFERRECEDVVAAFLRAHPDFAIESAAAAGGPRAVGAADRRRRRDSNLAASRRRGRLLRGAIAARRPLRRNTMARMTTAVRVRSSRSRTISWPRCRAS